MPTLLFKDGFKFFFYANEHEPCHVHVIKGDGYCKIEITDFKVVHKHMKPKDLKKALLLVKAHRNEFMRQWYEYFS